MRISSLLAFTLSASSILGVTAHSIQAIQAPDGTVSFEKPPRLLAANTTYKAVNAWGAKYYFTLTLPENAGKPLKQVTIRQVEGGKDIDFQDEVLAFEGVPRNKEKELAVEAVTQDEEAETVSIILESPVSPGKTFTLGLQPGRNPKTPGVYLFRVTAFPAGENPYSLDLGVGRLHFYRNGISLLY
ncbi:MAG: hypothetical protein BRC40_09810 [Cyanobacteria bacterium QH_8_48_120]|jgi:hypothetical protein|nr:MAG: hypothetical protein BRC35_09295 [Cyanobacteria bacterium QH_10_48_56]PSO60508.1 MAG: hypothetical protein BRC39_09745 [Cyanobacteria bacterium QH_7_48_89]PSO62857.1 MAG: hypothetical protein BRC36_09445 [Cyanobacteria bacterium QH_2_48_84]PSO65624.1 MAG: hypothetical protein BRC38_08140 [Cyanobacteria bacterium QH_6_48_35]PSO69333.1 MAG: hypothetical protein BRC42_11985 [Cyanobacteria bacterium QS_1_48_34]PSO72595.1 MAG: hypothetical protein BRC40_09810 [Cyanobacteria bacterium QH_8_4